jgi:hypothetical protein
MSDLVGSRDRPTQRYTIPSRSSRRPRTRRRSKKEQGATRCRSHCTASAARLSVYVSCSHMNESSSSRARLPEPPLHTLPLHRACTLWP